MKLNEAERKLTEAEECVRECCQTLPICLVSMHAMPEGGEADYRERQLRLHGTDCAFRALKLQRAAAGSPADADKALQELHDEIQAKDAALQGMSQQLLEVSAEKDELAQVT